MSSVTTDVPLAVSRRPRAFPNGWTITTVILAAVMAIPVATIVVLAMSPSDDIWAHLLSTVLPGYVMSTIGLMVGVAIGTVIIGVGTAWLVSTRDFPARRIFEWALLLPLAMPGYVIAFVYTDTLEFAGPVQGALRELFGWTSPRDYWFPEIRSLGGAITMLSLVLYPYIYLTTRTAFLEQSVTLLEAGRSLGRGPWRNFLTLAVPMARPAIIVGLTLAMMETLNDFGTVDFFAVSTMTAGIFDVWFNMNSISGAAQIATLMLLFVVVLIVAERWGRRRQKFHQSGTRVGHRPLRPLTGRNRILAFIACFLPLALGFIYPAVVLADMAFSEASAEALEGFISAAANSLTLSGLAAVFAVVIALFLGYGMRLYPNRVLAVAGRFSSLGYAVPGAVLAIGVITPLAWIDNSIDGVARSYLGFSTGLLLSGTIVAVTFGYVSRFLALSLGAVESGLGRITPNIDGAARTLGHSPLRVLRRIHVPMMRGSMLIAVILVFVDGMKELPMTLILRPFNFETLATQVQQFAKAEQFADAAPGALAIVAVGILPVILLSRVMPNRRK